MKVFLVLGGLYFLFNLIWTCPGEHQCMYNAAPLCSWPVSSQLQLKMIYLWPLKQYFWEISVLLTSDFHNIKFRYHPSDSNIRVEVQGIVFLCVKSSLCQCSPLLKFQYLCPVLSPPSSSCKNKYGNNADKQGAPPKIRNSKFIHWREDQPES